MGKHLRWLSMASAIGMGLVLFMGALVTKTESGEGCGTDWPLCNGKFVPAYTIESMIEYSHRFVSAAVGLLVLATAIATFMRLRHSREAQLFAYGTLFLTILQAFLGALAVIYPQSDAVMALHFGISLLALSTALLLVIGIRTGAYVPSSGKGRPVQEVQLHTPYMTRSLRNLIWSTTFYSYVVVYIGAFVRHTESVGGCLGWPLCNGEVMPSLEGATGIAFAHRVAAVVLLIFIAYITYKTSRPDNSSKLLRASGRWALLLTVLQIFSGATVVWTLTSDWYLLTALIHVVLVSGLFGVLCYMSVLAWRSSRSSKNNIR